jgi:predicted adenylyl cyclase CyaB
MHKNFEFKAKVDNIELFEEKLLNLNPRFVGKDKQVDTYFKANKGRLKLREGNIENALIQYHRSDTADAKLSEVLLYIHQPDANLKAILQAQFGVLIVVRKLRKIYFIDNVKFHFDNTENLGTFIEVEAIDTDGSLTVERLREQCDQYFSFFKLSNEQLVSKSYSDLLLECAGEEID